MHVLRGRARTIDADRDESHRLLELAAETGSPAVRVWAPHRQVAFGRRDGRLEGYDTARVAAEEHGFPPVERRVGGRAVAYDGETTLAFARAEPVDDFRRGTDERYERLTTDVETALADLGASVDRGEPDESFCPGAHSLSITAGVSDENAASKKIVGIAQRVTTDAALVSGILIVDNSEELAPVLDAVYGTLEVPFDPTSVGSLRDIDVPASVEAIRERLESALCRGCNTRVIDVQS